MLADNFAGFIVKIVISVSMFSLLGCATPIGMYTHSPEQIWLANVEQQNVSIAENTDHKIIPIVLKRFEGNYKVPVGGHFLGQVPSSEKISQAFAPVLDLSTPIYEATFSKLRSAKYPVWQDFNSSISKVTFKGPVNIDLFYVLQATIDYLELDSFATDASNIDEGVHAKMQFNLFDQSGQLKKQFSSDTIVRIRKGSGDILDALGQRIASEIAANIRGGV